MSPLMWKDQLETTHNRALSDKQTMLPREHTPTNLIGAISCHTKNQLIFCTPISRKYCTNQTFLKVLRYLGKNIGPKQPKAQHIGSASQYYSAKVKQKYNQGSKTSSSNALYIQDIHEDGQPWIHSTSQHCKCRVWTLHEQTDMHEKTTSVPDTCSWNNQMQSQLMHKQQECMHGSHTFTKLHGPGHQGVLSLEGFFTSDLECSWTQCVNKSCIAIQIACLCHY